MDWGLQLYSVRDSAAKDLKSTLETVSKLGYTQVEFAGFFDCKAQAVSDWLKQYGLRACSTHTPLQALEESVGDVAAYHRAIGCSQLIVPYTNPQTAQEENEIIQKLNLFQNALKREGITLGYHNHAHELRPAADGGCFLRRLMDETEVDFEFDVYWLYVAGADWKQWMSEAAQKGRLHRIHLKDGDPSGNGSPLGMGTAPVGEILRFARELNAQIIVESETLTPSGMEEARICMEYLKTQEEA